MKNPAEVLSRFFAKIERIPGGCWLWLGGKTKQGYGRISIDHRYTPAHRYSYATLVGQIPPGHVVHHQCRVRRCVNPRHLEAVTRRVNVLLGDTVPAGHVKKTHCPAGHEYGHDNTYVYRRMRYCKRCRNAHRAASKLRNPRLTNGAHP